ncbi:aminoacyl-tRNA hydrolase [Pediococcus siamensis]|uniref:aminoacyl-tRNA hydrolase n=1 Tax=Pediococcus siamensis TaxID=381829 RepID=UPI00399F0F9A
MKMIVGLGNIGTQYDETRHNTGFMVVDQFAQVHHAAFTKHQMEAAIATVVINGEKVLLVKPSTYMNESGRAVRPLMDYYKIALEDLIVVYDDMDLPVGKIRFRKKGAAGGHNGIKSLIAHLKTQTFDRLKVGTDHPQKTTVVNYVLSKFTPAQKPLFEESVTQSLNGLEDWVNGMSIADLMNKYN